MIKLSELEAYFAENPPPEEPLRLNKHTKIINQKKFVESSIKILKSNPGNKGYSPYYTHLIEYYEFAQKAND